MVDQPNKVNIKIVTIGDGSVGKTCMLLSYTQDKFPTDYLPTVFDNYSADIKYENKFIALSLWDTAGQESYNQLRSLSYPQSDVFLIVFSVTEKASFENAMKKWYPEVHQKMPEAIKIFAGNKIDLRDEKNMKPNDVAKETVEKMVKDLGCSYIECSALTQDGLKQVFQEAVRLVLKQREKPQKEETKACCNLI